jgi:hypothetical protein
MLAINPDDRPTSSEVATELKRLWERCRAHQDYRAKGIPTPGSMVLRIKDRNVSTDLKSIDNLVKNPAEDNSDRSRPATEPSTANPGQYQSESVISTLKRTANPLSGSTQDPLKRAKRPAMVEQRLIIPYGHTELLKEWLSKKYGANFRIKAV